MTSTLTDVENPPAGVADGSDSGAIPGRFCSKIPTPKAQVSQAENIASSITCASMRAAALRANLVREILRVAAIGMQAQAALLDDDDDAALAHLREHWTVTRATIATLAAELRQLGEPRK
jgi:hypothetical protein